jgi:hypothetical protein
VHKVVHLLHLLLTGCVLTLWRLSWSAGVVRLPVLSRCWLCLQVLELLDPSCQHLSRSSVRSSTAAEVLCCTTIMAPLPSELLPQQHRHCCCCCEPYEKMQQQLPQPKSTPAIWDMHLTAQTCVCGSVQAAAASASLL